MLSARDSASSHIPHFSQAVIAAPKLITSAESKLLMSKKARFLWTLAQHHFPKYYEILVIQKQSPRWQYAWPKQINGQLPIAPTLASTDCGISASYAGISC